LFLFLNIVLINLDRSMAMMIVREFFFYLMIYFPESVTGISKNN
jgi:hypothetical protein